MAVDVRNSKEADINGALQSRASNNVQSNNVVRQQYAVRRLTPLECERLQGLPDGWTLIDDKSCSDSARYKAIGNGMAQPVADWVIKRIVEEVGEQNDRSLETCSN
jgi:DNA (cytosine-5)-methyltransferase 1